jgi:hypothetical protein
MSATMTKKTTKKKAKRAKRKKTAAPAKKRQRRTDQQLIKDLQAKIEDVKGRAKTRELKRSPALKAAIAAVRGIDRALVAAAEQGESLLRHALADSRKNLVAYLSSQGFKAPKAKLPRGRKPKGA